MALDHRVAEKWETLLYNWALWRADPGHAPVSSAYNGSRRPDGWTTANPIRVEQALDVDALMESLRRTQATRHLYRALEVWILAEGTRGQQAARLAVSTRTLYAHVDAAKALLERMARNRRRL